MRENCFGLECSYRSLGNTQAANFWMTKLELYEPRGPTGQQVISLHVTLEHMKGEDDHTQVLSFVISWCAQCRIWCWEGINEFSPIYFRLRSANTSGYMILGYKKGVEKTTQWLAAPSGPSSIENDEHGIEKPLLKNSSKLNKFWHSEVNLLI